MEQNRGPVRLRSEALSMGVKQAARLVDNSKESLKLLLRFHTGLRGVAFNSRRIAEC